MIVALLPVRNGAADLPGWFASVEGVVDAVIALDDGSTDTTATLLASEPIVHEVLTNPSRPDETGWDDRANRQRLLDAAIEADADWVLWLDADERLASGDGQVLRRFVEHEADPDEAYGFALFDRVGPDGFAPEPKWVYRLHACRPGDRFPDRRLHFPPVPTRVDRGRWLRTSLRLEHLGMATTDRRRARHEKYRKVDPDHRWQRTYDHLLEVPDDVIAMPDREPGPVVLGVHANASGPDLSVVVLCHHDRAHIDAVVDSVLDQEVDGKVEVVVVVSGHDGSGVHLRSRGDIEVIDLGPTVTPGAARNAARDIVSGDFVVFVGSHVRLEPGSLAARLAAHRRGWAMVTGPLLDGSTSRAARAAFFLDHTASSRALPNTTLDRPPPRCSYVRFALDRVGWFPDVRAGEDTDVNDRLFAAGFTAGFEPGAAETYVPDVHDLHALRTKHAARGRALARLRVERGSEPPRIGIGYVRRRLARLVRAGLRHPDRRRFVLTLPEIIVGVLAARRGYVTRSEQDAERGP